MVNWWSVLVWLHSFHGGNLIVWCRQVYHMNVASFNMRLFWLICSVFMLISHSGSCIHDWEIRVIVVKRKTRQLHLLCTAHCMYVRCWSDTWLIWTDERFIPLDWSVQLFSLYCCVLYYVKTINTCLLWMQLKPYETVNLDYLFKRKCFICTVQVIIISFSYKKK